MCPISFNRLYRNCSRIKGYSKDSSDPSARFPATDMTMVASTSKASAIEDSIRDEDFYLSKCNELLEEIGIEKCRTNDEYDPYDYLFKKIEDSIENEEPLLSRCDELLKEIENKKCRGNDDYLFDKPELLEEVRNVKCREKDEDDPYDYLFGKIENSIRDDDLLLSTCSKLLEEVRNDDLQLTCLQQHKDIPDQPDVSKESRRRKLPSFPNEEEHERRLIKQVRQADVVQMPAEAMLEMKGIFSIPCTESEPIEDVIFVEPPIARVNEAIEQVKRYNEEGKPWVRRFGRTERPEPLVSDHRNETPQFIGTTRISI